MTFHGSSQTELEINWRQSVQVLVPEIGRAYAHKHICAHRHHHVFAQVQGHRSNACAHSRAHMCHMGAGFVRTVIFREKNHDMDIDMEI